VNDGVLNLQNFVQRLAVVLTNWQATTFLVGEYFDDEQHSNPLYTIADSIFHLAQDSHRNAIVRKLQVIKLRGLAPMPGLHTFRISDQGLQVYPRMSMNADDKSRTLPLPRQDSGVAGLDALMGGGIPAGDAMLVSGPSGSGKTILASQFIAAGGVSGENGVIAVFEEHPAEYLRRAKSLGIDLESMLEAETLRVIYILSRADFLGWHRRSVKHL
jgi:circadian clock protein KaiC